MRQWISGFRVMRITLDTFHNKAGLQDRSTDTPTEQTCVSARGFSDWWGRRRQTTTLGQQQGTRKKYITQLPPPVTSCELTERAFV